MAKTKKRWIVGTARTAGTFTEFSNPDAVTSDFVPYDSTTSVREAINQALITTAGATGPAGPVGQTGISPGAQGDTGVQGLPGATGLRGVTGAIGLQGITGLGTTGLQGQTGIQGETGFGITGPVGNTGAFGGPPGATGIQGETGLIGSTGLGGPTGVDGATGIQGLGLTGLQGSQGDTGSQGETGAQGYTGAIGPSGLTGAQGIQGITGFQGIYGNTGYQGITGFPGIGNTGLQGSTGISAQTILFNPVNRYLVHDISDEQVWVVSSSLVYNGVAWSRSGTTLTINRNAHGHSAGNRVIVRNTNVDYQNVTIDSTTANAFNVTTTGTGTTSGNGAYSMGFTFANIGSPKTGGQVYAPAGDHSDCQLLAIRIRTGTRASSIYDLVVPASATNGAGANTSLADCFIPDFNVRTESDTLPAVAATIATNIGGSYSTFEFGNLGLGSLSRIITAHF